MPFVKATKTQGYLRLALSGVAGAGKSYTALRIGSQLAALRGSRLAMLDTEHGSGERYADLFDYDIDFLADSFNPELYIEKVKEAQRAGYKVLIIDSLSHAWMGTGGALELVDQHATYTSRGRKDTYHGGWGFVTPLQNRMINTILGSRMDIIATLRAKPDFVDTGGSIQRVGTSTIQREGVDHEFDIWFSMTPAKNDAKVEKSRCHILKDGRKVPLFRTGEIIPAPDERIADTLYGWLVSGMITLTEEFWRTVETEQLDRDFATVGETWCKDQPHYPSALERILFRLREMKVAETNGSSTQPEADNLPQEQTT